MLELLLVLSTLKYSYDLFLGTVGQPETSNVVACHHTCPELSNCVHIIIV